MYLSRLILNPRDYMVQKELGNIYQIHRTIMHAFPNNLHSQPNREGRVLFRVESRENTQDIQVLVQSPEKPEWTHLYARNGYLKERIQVKSFEYPKFHSSQSFWYKILANPTKKVKQTDSSQSKSVRVGLLKETDQLEWLKRKGEQNGFSIVKSFITQKRKYSGKIIKPKRSLTFLGIKFEGMLQVTNPELFNTALISGIGSAKGFGFGLLSISK